MSEYRLQDGELISERALRQGAKNTLLPRVLNAVALASLGASAVLATPKPIASGVLKTVQRDGVLLDGLGNWVQAWREVDKFTSDEQSSQAEKEEAYRLELIAAKKTALQRHALVVETAGVTIDNQLVGSDREAVARVTSALSLLGRSPGASIPFSTRSGAWLTGDKASLEGLQTVLWAHLKATAENEKAHSDALDGLSTAQAVADHDITSGWPGA
ncbi:MAG: hypothetical protein JKX92_05425 [Porticoccaceae bacterium]|nr:hypothetical protein [Porticoccaceae bacterium]